MHLSILSENQSKRMEQPLWMLICFAMFNAWQMGFIYFMGPSLVLDGRTPLPISMDNVTALIAAGYVLSIIFMLALPRLVVWAARVTAGCALLSILGLYLPLSAPGLTALLYVQTFCCCFMIGFETFIISNLFSERSCILHLTAAYAVALFITALVQNDLMAISFNVFRGLSLIMLLMLLVFFFRLPGSREIYPEYIRTKDAMPCPSRLFGGLILYSFVADIMMLGGPAAVAEIHNGVFTAYFADGAAALLLFALYVKAGRNPLDLVSVFMGLSAIGYLGLYLASVYIPALAYPACVLVGLGFIPCQLMPLYGLTMMKSYPSRLIAPGVIFMALISVLVHSGLVEAFRAQSSLLNIAYFAITLVCIVVYWHLAPYLIHVFGEKLGDAGAKRADTPGAKPELPAKEAAAADQTVSARLSLLTARELEVLELIGGGYSNRDIARMLVISEHTVNDYTKKIYRKLEVHSRHSAAQIINRYQ